MFGHRAWGIENGHAAVARKVARDPAVTPLVARKDLEKVAQLQKNLVGRERFAQGGEADEVGKQYGHMLWFVIGTGLTPLALGLGVTTTLVETQTGLTS